MSTVDPKTKPHIRWPSSLSPSGARSSFETPMRVAPQLGQSYSMTLPSVRLISTSPRCLTPQGHVSSKWRSATRKKNPAARNGSQILKPLTTRSLGHIEPASQPPTRPLAHGPEVRARARLRGLGAQLHSRRMPAVTFLSDYGLDDDFVGVCHGVIAGIAPEVRVIDITHGIPRHDVRAGALVLRRALSYMPPGVHLAVVDPGVGSERRAVALRCGDAIPRRSRQRAAVARGRAPRRRDGARRHRCVAARARRGLGELPRP